MTDIVFNCASYDVLLSEARRLGFTYTDDGGVEQIKVNGPMASGGDYFLNYVGTVYDNSGAALTGVWGRLRANGLPSDLPPFDSDITQYVYSVSLNGWTADGVTVAPDYVGMIGVIA